MVVITRMNDKHWTLSHTIAVSLDEVKANFSRYGMLDQPVHFLKGWFKDTLPTAPIERLAILRLDGDMYSSTFDALKHLYPKLSRGGFVIVDDYHIDACRKAVTDFRERNDDCPNSRPARSSIHTAAESFEDPAE